MLLGGSVVRAFASPAEWAAFAKAQGFRATSAPFNFETPRETVEETLAAAKARGIVIAEVGVWNNPLAKDPKAREEARCAAKRQLKLADDIGCPCCVNIAGAVGERWDGAYRENYGGEAYRATVDSIREILDEVKPSRAYYTIEPMPWMAPDGPDQYLKLIQDVDREMFAAHLDFVNMINSARRALFAEEFILECLEKLAPHIKSCHAKDIRLHDSFTTMIEEVSPGEGRLDYAKVLRALDRYLSKDAPVLLEHMRTDEEYKKSFDFLGAIARREGIFIG